MRSAVVTGGTGFIGHSLVTVLRGQGVDVRTLGRSWSTDASHVVLQETAWKSSALDHILEDSQPDCIFHLAGRSRGTQDELTNANIVLMQNLLDALDRTGLRPRLVVAGSAAEYGGAITDGVPVCETAACAPQSPYGLSKRAQTEAALSYANSAGGSVLVARIFNPIGPDMPRHLALGDFVSQIVSMQGSRQVLRVGNIDVRRDMIDVEHAATVLWQLAVNPDAQGIVNVCSGQAPLLRDLVEMLIEGSGQDIDIEIDWSRVRGNEPRCIVGSTDLLARLGCLPVATDFPAVMERICQGLKQRARPSLA
jgi:GDP-4-dehydro-6-deoxy-D-mannose reductase